MIKYIYSPFLIFFKFTSIRRCEHQPQSVSSSLDLFDTLEIFNHLVIRKDNLREFKISFA
jgi:hypothetical protein